MNLHFQKIEIQDLAFLCEVRNHYAQDFLHDSRTFTIKETCDWFENTKPDFWIIKDADLKMERIGYFRLSNHSAVNKNIYIGADVAPQFRGLGYAKKAYSLFIPMIFENYKLNKISLEVLSSNTVAINLYNKLGFVKEGVKRQEVWKKGGFVDSIIMSILREDYHGSILESK